MPKEWAPPEADAICPVPLETLNQLSRADASTVLAEIRDFSEEKRVRLALYCYNRSHLRMLGLIVAASVDPARLAALAGPMGEVMAAQSRASGLSFGTEPQEKKPEKAKAKISLGGRG